MDHVILFNSPSGRQLVYETDVGSTSYSIPAGSNILWNTLTHGPIRFKVFVEPGGDFFYAHEEDANNTIVSQVGIWVKEYGPNAGGIPGTIPYLASYSNEEFTFIPTHWQWMLDNYRKAITLFSVKAWMIDLPGTIYADVTAAIEATYAASPLNKVRWEEREFVPFGGTIFNIIKPFLDSVPTYSNYIIFKAFDSEVGELYYTDSDEDNLPG